MLLHMEIYSLNMLGKDDVKDDWDEKFRNKVLDTCDREMHKTSPPEYIPL